MNLNKKEKETLMYCVFAFAVGYLMCMYFPIHSKTNGGYVLEGVDNADNDKADKADNDKADNANKANKANKANNNKADKANNNKANKANNDKADKANNDKKETFAEQRARAKAEFAKLGL